MLRIGVILFIYCINVSKGMKETVGTADMVSLAVAFFTLG